MGVAVLSFLVSIVGSLWTGYKMNVDSIKENTLETNKVYASKLATTANSYLEEAIQILGYSASILSKQTEDSDALVEETERLKMQNNLFNSVVVTNEKGLVLAVSPPSIEVQGQYLYHEEAKKSLAAKEPFISKPYEGITGRLLIFISYPIFNEAGEHLGLIGGTIFLKEKNVFNALLGQHYYDDGSYVYVVDGDGRIIYHQDPSRINDVVLENKVVQKVVEGKSGAQGVTNTKGIELLAGYSSVPLANWGVVTQRPLDVALKAPFERVVKFSLISLPFVLISFVVVMWAAAKVALPLQQLATLTEESMDKRNVDDLKSVRSWYFEAYYLKDALVRSLSFLQAQVSFFKDQSTVDPLTGLTNRRTMDALMEEWNEQGRPYSIILLDLDHFKSVNDNFGHAVGDKVLIYLAKNMQDIVLEKGVCCRFGGEEFIILLPNVYTEEAAAIAEVLREKCAVTNSPCGRPVTLSAGVATYPEMAKTAEELIVAADEALYSAKQTGRNKVVIAQVKELEELK